MKRQIIETPDGSYMWRDGKGWIHSSRPPSRFEPCRTSSMAHGRGPAHPSRYWPPRKDRMKNEV